MGDGRSLRLARNARGRRSWATLLVSVVALLVTLPAGADVTVPPHSISIDDVTQVEGNSGTTTFGFTATLTNPPAENFSLKVNYATANGTATGGTSCGAGVDYVTTSGQVTFNKNQLDRPINVSVCGDTSSELDETFFVDLSNPEHDAILTKSRGTGTIRNDDAVLVRSTSTTVDCPASTAANSPANCTVTVRDTAAGTPSAPLGTVNFSFTSQPTGSSPTVAPNPCTLAPDTGTPANDDSTCTITFTANTTGSYTINGTYQPTSAHTTSNGSDTITVTARTTSTTINCPATTPANSPASCTVTVADTDTAPKSAPLGTVNFEFTAQPADSSPTVTTNPCTLTPGTASSTCTIIFKGDRLGDYTIEGTYQPAPASVHASSTGSDTITVTARTTSTTINCPASTPANTPATCTATVTDTDTAPKSPPLGSVDFAITAQPGGSSATVAPDPCLPTANGDGESSSCTITFTGDTPGNYTVEGSYQPAPASVHATSTDSDTIQVTARQTSTRVECPASTPANTPATCTTTVTDTDTAPKSPPLGTVDFEFTAQPSGSAPTLAPDPCTLDPDDGDSSSCTVVFNSTKAGAYTIKGTYQPTSVHAASSSSDSITVTAGPPEKVMVTPAADTNEVNTEHCVTATVTDKFDNPNEGVTVRFSVTGANPTSGAAVTNANGQAEFCYTGVLAGPDLIRAFADTNNNETRDLTPLPPEPEGEATKTWTAPPSTPLCIVDFTTLGIQIIARNGDHGTGGGNVHVSDTGVASGSQEYQDHGPADPLNVHSTQILAVVCETTTGGKRATIYFVGTVDGMGPRAGRIQVEDNGEPGTNDNYWIIVSKLTSIYDSGKQQLTGGNVQIH